MLNSSSGMIQGRKEDLALLRKVINEIFALFTIIDFQNNIMISVLFKTYISLMTSVFSLMTTILLIK